MKEDKRVTTKVRNRNKHVEEKDIHVSENGGDWKAVTEGQDKYFYPNHGNGKLDVEFVQENGVTNLDKYVCWILYSRELTVSLSNNPKKPRWTFSKISGDSLDKGYRYRLCRKSGGTVRLTANNGISLSEEDSSKGTGKNKQKEDTKKLLGSPINITIRDDGPDID